MLTASGRALSRCVGAPLRNSRVRFPIAWQSVGGLRTTHDAWQRWSPPGLLSSPVRCLSVKPEDKAPASDAEPSAAEVEEKVAKIKSSVASALETAEEVLRAVFGMRPKRRDSAVTPADAVVPNTTVKSVMVVDATQTRWERLASHLQSTPLIQSILAVKQQLAESAVGQAAKQVKDKVNDTKESLQEKWETSQHPLVYNAAAAYDHAFTETEWAQSLRALRQIDSRFDVPAFVEEMRYDIIPTVIRAFLVGDRKTLSEWCKETAMSQLNAVFRAREAEGLQQNPTVLSISNVDLAAAKIVGRGSPVMLVTAMVQQINCITNAKGEVVEGNEDEIRAVFYAFAMVREYEPSTASLHWKVAEMSMIGSQLYL